MNRNNNDDDARKMLENDPQWKRMLARSFDPKDWFQRDEKRKEKSGRREKNRKA